MDKISKIYVAGHKGMVGSAISRGLAAKGYTNIIGSTVDQLDLTNQQAVADFFSLEKPDYVILAAAKVGGIMANNVYRAQFIYENLMIESNIIHHAYLNDVKKLLFLGSSCIYPKNAPQPLKEEYLLTGELEQTNEPYAIAKIAGIKLCESYYRQYGSNFISVMPTNLYGPNDNYNLETSHVLPAIIRKMHLAHCLEMDDMDRIRQDLTNRPIEGITGVSSNEDIIGKLKQYGISKSKIIEDPNLLPIPVTLKLWGTGNVYREFMHVNDMAAACIKILEEIDAPDLMASPALLQSSSNSCSSFINIGTGEDQTIAEIADLIKKIVGFRGTIEWDNSKPDGTYKKLMDNSSLRSLGFNTFLPLVDGIRSEYSNYIA